MLATMSSQMLACALKAPCVCAATTGPNRHHGSGNTQQRTSAAAPARPRLCAAAAECVCADPQPWQLLPGSYSRQHRQGLLGHNHRMGSTVGCRAWLPPYTSHSQLQCGRPHCCPHISDTHICTQTCSCLAWFSAALSIALPSLFPTHVLCGLMVHAAGVGPGPRRAQHTQRSTPASRHQHPTPAASAHWRPAAAAAVRAAAATISAPAAAGVSQRIRWPAAASRDASCIWCRQQTDKLPLPASQPRHQQCPQ